MILDQDTEIQSLKEKIECKDGSLKRLNTQVVEAINEASEKSTQYIAAIKEIGQVSSQLKEVKAHLESAENENAKLIKANTSFSKEVNVLTDNLMALRDENLQLQRTIINQDKAINNKDKLIQEKDDLIGEIKTPKGMIKCLFGKK